MLLMPPRFRGANRANGHNYRSRYFRFTASTRKGKVLIRRKLKRHYVLAFFEKLQACLA